MEPDPDTIAAIATPPGSGGIGIVRVSGKNSRSITQAIFAQVPPARTVVYGPFKDAQARVIDHGLVLFFPAPHSYTGEDVVEFHGHGGPVVMDMLLRAIIQAGSRLARPGEFTERAYLNGKMDLFQAEAVADLIAGVSEQAVRCANRSLQGEFSRHIQHLNQQLIDLRVYVEAALDFPEEEIDFLAAVELKQRLAAINEQFNFLLRTAKQGAILREGMKLVVMGEPNVGKSSLINQLAAQDISIVTPIAGTTRDVLREHIQIDGIPFVIADTAGLRDTLDPVEQEGIRRARQTLETADIVLFVTEAQRELTPYEQQFLQALPPGPAVIVIKNKIDLTRQAPQVLAGPTPTVLISAQQGLGVDLLRLELKKLAGFYHHEGLFTARRRHLEALRQSFSVFKQALESFHKTRAGELLADDLRWVHQHLGEITGEFTSDALLGKIFSEFCIGK